MSPPDSPSSEAKASRPHPLSTPPTVTLTLTVVTLAALSVSLVRSQRRLHRALHQRQALASALRRHATASTPLEDHVRATLQAVEWETARPRIYGGLVAPPSARVTQPSDPSPSSWDWTPSSPPKGPSSLAASHWSRMSREELRKGWAATVGEGVVRQRREEEEGEEKAIARPEESQRVTLAAAPLADSFQLRLDIANEVLNEVARAQPPPAPPSPSGSSSNGHGPTRRALQAERDVPAIPTSSSVDAPSASSDVVPLEPPKPRMMTYEDSSTSAGEKQHIPKPASVTPTSSSDVDISSRLRQMLSRPERATTPPPVAARSPLLIKQKRDDAGVRLSSRSESIRAAPSSDSATRPHSPHVWSWMEHHRHSCSPWRSSCTGQSSKPSHGFVSPSHGFVSPSHGFVTRWHRLSVRVSRHRDL